MNPKQDKPKVNYTKTHHSQTPINGRKREKVESGKRETNNTFLLGEKEFEWLQFLLWNHTGHKEMAYIFQLLQENNCQPRILYPVKISSVSTEEIKTFWDEGKLRECMACRHILK